MYNGRTREEWQSVWRQICDMAYLHKNICEEIIIVPLKNSSSSKHIDEELMLDFIWNEYNEKYHEVQIVPELKKLLVPKELFLSLGISQWFEYSFPNCSIEFW